MTAPSSHHSKAPIKPFAVLRELVNTRDAFYQGVTGHVQQFGLSAEQFDVVATPGMLKGAFEERI